MEKILPVVRITDVMYVKHFDYSKSVVLIAYFHPPQMAASKPPFLIFLLTRTSFITVFLKDYQETHSLLTWLWRKSVPLIFQWTKKRAAGLEERAANTCRRCVSCQLSFLSPNTSVWTISASSGWVDRGGERERQKVTHDGFDHLN